MVMSQHIRDGSPGLGGPGGEIADPWDGHARDGRERASPIGFEEFIETLPVPVFRQDARGVYTGANAAFAAFVGRSREEVPGLTALEVWDAQVAALSITTDAPLLAAPRRQTYECRVRRGDGVTRDALFHRATFLDPAGDIGGLVGIVVDVTERAHADIQLREAGAVAEAAIEGVNRSLAGMSRDVQVVLSFLLRSRDLLHEQVPVGAVLVQSYRPEPANRSGKHIPRQAGRLLAIPVRDAGLASCTGSATASLRLE